MSLRNLLIVGGLAASFTGTAIAAPIVVRASGPAAASYPAGKMLSENARITLAANDTLVILDARGTRTLRGPGVFTASTPASATSAQANFSALINPQDRRRARTGAVRGDPMPSTSDKRAPSLWYVDISRGSTVCLADLSAAMLWRPDFEKAAVMTLTDTASGKSTKLAWRDAQPTMSWPADLPPKIGASYRITGAGLAKPTDIRIATIAMPETMEKAATALLANKCEAQLEVLIAGVAVADETPSGGAGG